MAKHMYFLLIAGILFLNGQANAQLKPWSKIFLFDGAYAAVTGKETNNSLEGYAFNIGFEQLSKDGKWSAGIGLMRLNAQDSDEQTQEEINYTSLPVTL
jgi:hypothetical protein